MRTHIRLFAKIATAAVAAAVCILIAGGVARADSSGPVTYTASQTIAVPPASSYAGSGGGDGWGLAFSESQVFNVFHHQQTLQIACHEQADASACYDPRTIADTNGNNFATSGKPGLYYDTANKDVYVFATRVSDQTGGVVCIDTIQAAANPNPFCGFTALTAADESPVAGNSAISEPQRVGNDWYAFNYATGDSATGAKNKLLCFDLVAHAACASQPFALTLPAGPYTNSDFPSPAVSQIGGKIIVAITASGDSLACFDPSTGSNCAGRWPVALNFAFSSDYGTAFPDLDGSGTVLGFCLPTGTDPCFDLRGASLTTPAGMTSAIGGGTGWNGSAIVLGPRVYVPQGGIDNVACYDATLHTSCANFPHATPGADYLYTVNPDPQRPTCLWVNADGGDRQIQNFDAYTGSACSNDHVRVLASSFVVDTPQCEPATYTSLQVTDPPRASYSSGAIEFDDSDATKIQGIPDKTLDQNGAVDLSNLELNTDTGLPQFVITLSGHQGPVGSVTVKLVWTGTDDPSCVKPGTTTTGSGSGGGGSTGGGGGVTVTPPTTSPACAAPFPDVAADSTFCDDITWLVGHKITIGYDDHNFHPTDGVTRQAMAAFLYRLANPDKQAPACVSAPFTDVPKTSVFCPEIQWLKRHKVSSGFAGNEFKPTQLVTRQAMAAFMYRLVNGASPAPACASAEFPDVPAASPFCGVIHWLVAHSITTGYPDGGFHPAEIVSRQAMAAFLHRLSALL